MAEPAIGIADEAKVFIHPCASRYYVHIEFSIPYSRVLSYR